jgi:defect-in-organelle-trafficking protein DotD
MFLPLWVLLTSILTLAGCSVLRHASDTEPKTIAFGDPLNNTSEMKDSHIESEILKAAESIEKSLKTLAAAQEAKGPPIIITAPLLTPEGGMGGKVDINWIGPIVPLLHKIGELSQYRVKILGNEPAIPIIITITAKKTALAEVLQNASLQAGKRAEILAFPEEHVIELRYL